MLHKAYAEGDKEDKHAPNSFDKGKNEVRAPCATDDRCFIAACSFFSIAGIFWISLDQTQDSKPAFVSFKFDVQSCSPSANTALLGSG